MLLPVWSLTEIQASGGDRERRVPAAIADDRLTLASRKQLGARMADGPIHALRPPLVFCHSAVRLVCPEVATGLGHGP